MNPNFPVNLDIKPSKSASAQSENERFGTEAQHDAIQTYGIAGRVWEAAYAMMLYLDPSSVWSFDPPPFTALKWPTPLSLVELGSGTGIVAALVAKNLNLEDLLVATDLPEVCSLLRRNLPESPSLAIEPLAWGNEDHAKALKSLLLRRNRPSGLTHIICSDLVYFPELLAPLLRSLLHLTTSNHETYGSSPTVVISYMIRSLVKETAFWSAFGLWFSFTPVLVKKRGSDEGDWGPLNSALGDDPFYIFHAERHPESFAWRIPSSDQELLDGVGANGSLSRKGDTTFESLLLFSMEDTDD
ncbi:putative methyltransferase-domain-containing protein [Coprinopsis sp. MPI-PUGE-AT-0042]|nr:putative methyltransferase-domain-containing protein [Coprinopsis sp. MPI-PUGE-AT-0042]